MSVSIRIYLKDDKTDTRDSSVNSTSIIISMETTYNYAKVIFHIILILSLKISMYIPF